LLCVFVAKRSFIKKKTDKKLFRSKLHSHGKKNNSKTTT